MTTKMTRWLGLSLLGVVTLAGCDDSFNILNTNAPTQEALTGSPTRLTLAQTAIGIQSQMQTNVGGMIQQWGIYGREGWNLNGNDPRETVEEISGPQDPGGRAGGQWGGSYTALRTIHTYLAALDQVADLSDAERAASRGFAKTVKAFHLHHLAVRSGPLGIPVDVDRPINAEPAPFVSQDAAFTAVASLLDEAATDLAAGGGSFPFTLGAGFTGFTTPGSFLQFNRALKAKVSVNRATLAGCGAPCWNDALSALSGSFISTTGDLQNGVYFFYSTAAGEPANPIAENLGSVRYWVHPSIEADAQLRGDGTPDLRLTEKTRAVATSRTLNGLTGTLKPIMYNTNTPTSSSADLGRDIPLIKNEELILLRAEANLALGTKQAAIDDINVIRTRSGGLDPTSLTAGSADDAILTEILYNRTMSLLWEQGTRWVDARKYGRIGSLPLDRPGDVVHPHMLVPQGECDARGLQVPCSP